MKHLHSILSQIDLNKKKGNETIKICRKIIEQDSKKIYEAIYFVHIRDTSTKKNIHIRYNMNLFHGCSLDIDYHQEKDLCILYHDNNNEYGRRRHWSKLCHIYDIASSKIVEKYQYNRANIRDDVHGDTLLLDHFCKNLVNTINHQIETEAAIKIQKAFRGWSVRHKYRWSPHNNLGRFLIAKMFL